jgi:heat shock protein HslJ
MTKHSHHKSHRNRTIVVAVLIVAALAVGGYYAMQDDEIQSWVYDFLSIGGEREIQGTTWSWKRTELPNGTVIEGPGGDEYLLTFGNDGRLVSTTDCNSVFGDYSLLGTGMSVGQLASTRKACRPDSLEAEYTKELARTSAFDMSSRELRLYLEDDTGVMIFSRRN